MAADDVREAAGCDYCQAWDHPSSECPEPRSDPFVDADLWEAEASRVNAGLLADFGMGGAA